MQDRSEQLTQSAERLESHSMNMADQATDEFDHDLALGRPSAQQNALYEVEAALRRIEDGSYGVCEETGEPIPAARLRAIPWTRFARAVESRLESEGAVPGARLGALGSIRAGLAGDLEASAMEEEKPSPAAQDESLRTISAPPDAVQRQTENQHPQRKLPHGSKRHEQS